MARSKTDPWNPATLREEKFWPIDLIARALALLVANKLGVFQVLSGGPRQAQEIAAKLGCDAKGMRILLDAMVALQYLKKKDDLYENGQDTSLFLTKESERYIGTRLVHIYDGIPRWLRLEDLVRHGQKHKQKLPEFRMSEVEKGKSAREFALGLSESSKATAALVAEVLDLDGVTDLLDLGGGAGMYAIEMAKNYPALIPVVLDLPVPAQVAKEQIEKAGMKERVRVKTSDFLLDDLGDQEYDVVFLSNIVHNLSESDNRSVLKKIWKTLRSGGEIIIKDMMPNDRRDGPYYPLLFALTMLMFTDSGDTYPVSQVKEWLKSAGFKRITHKTLIQGESSIMTGYKK